MSAQEQIAREIVAHLDGTDSYDQCVQAITQALRDVRRAALIQERQQLVHDLGPYFEPKHSAFDLHLKLLDHQIATQD